MKMNRIYKQRIVFLSKIVQLTDFGQNLSGCLINGRCPSNEIFKWGPTREVTCPIWMAIRIAIWKEISIVHWELLLGAPHVTSRSRIHNINFQRPVVVVVNREVIFVHIFDENIHIREPLVRILIVEVFAHRHEQIVRSTMKSFKARHKFIYIYIYYF